jgi:hypothetical protein
MWTVTRIGQIPTYPEGRLTALKLSGVMDVCLNEVSVSKAAFNQKFGVPGGVLRLAIRKVHAQAALSRV